MAETIAAHETSDYQPGVNQAPGSGSEGDDPLGLRYANLGPLAFVLNEAMDSAVISGADKDSLVEQIAQMAGEGFSESDVIEVLSDKQPCPPAYLLQAFANTLNIDLSIILDAAEKGGCKNLGPIPTVPPGY